MSKHGAFKAKELGGVRHSHGQVIGDADKERSRWEVHFAELFGGELCESVPDAFGGVVSDLMKKNVAWPRSLPPGTNKNTWPQSHVGVQPDLTAYRLSSLLQVACLQ